MENMQRPYYRESLTEWLKDESKFQLFTARVLTVDYERVVCTVRDTRSSVEYQDVQIIPDGPMPEPGWVAVCCNTWSRGGLTEIAIVSWVLTNTTSGKQAVAFRLLDGVPGLQDRTRMLWRKAWPGERTATLSGGYTEHEHAGWSREDASLGHDSMDSLRRKRTAVSSRTLRYDDAGLDVSGLAERTNASSVVGTKLPDGSVDQVAMLAPAAVPQNRYTGMADAIAWAERLTLTQEFALDFPVPSEAVRTNLLDAALGSTASPWARTAITTNQDGFGQDGQEWFVSNQPWDNPSKSAAKAVGPLMEEAPTPARRGNIVERAEGTLIGYNRFDQATYGQVLKPVLFPATRAGRFSVSPRSGYLPVLDSPWHTESRLAASAFALRFPYEQNTTRFDVTKEGMVSFEIGATLPAENIPWNNGQATAYEHPHGAGRSLEAHLVGSLKMVVGKNRDEEEAIDLSALGQTVLRLGADDASLPNQRRSVATQIRQSGDAVSARTLQYWASPKLALGDMGDPVNKTGASGLSVWGATDGGIALRLGARSPDALRRYMKNGYKDGPGTVAWAVTDPNRQDSKTDGRPTYGAGDQTYRFHDLTQTARPQLSRLPYNWSGPPLQNPDQHGLSLDVHAVRDILVRAGANPLSGQSLLVDTAGGIVAAVGSDTQNRSLTIALDGGIEMTVGPNKQGKGWRLELRGDVDWVVGGNFHLNVGGDYVMSASGVVVNSRTDLIQTGQKITEKALIRHTIESVDIVQNQGLFLSGPEA